MILIPQFIANQNICVYTVGTERMLRAIRCTCNIKLEIDKYICFSVLYGFIEFTFEARCEVCILFFSSEIDLFDSFQIQTFIH